MSIYVGSDGISRTVSKLYAGIDGRSRQVSKVYTGENGKARLVYQSGSPISGLSVGSIVKIAVNGTAMDYIVVHQGKPSADYDDSCAGTWVLSKDCYVKSAFGDSNDYESSYVRSYLDDTFFGLLDPEVQSVVKQAKIPYKDSVGIVQSGNNGLSSKVFLLSTTEINFSASIVLGSSVAYFSDGNSRIAYMDGAATGWWTRTPTVNDTVNSYCVNLNGFLSAYGRSSNMGVRPTMVLSPEALVDEDKNVIS